MKWIYLGDSANPGHWQSADGRFFIDPQYGGTTRPQWYQLNDSNDKDRPFTTHNTVRHAKMHADDITRRETKKL